MKTLRVLMSLILMVALGTSLAIAVDKSVTLRIRLDPYTLDPTMIYTSDVNIVGRIEEPDRLKKLDPKGGERIRVSEW